MADSDDVLKGRPPARSDNQFWKDYLNETINKTVEGLDDRAKYMITTCAGLIVVNFGLLLVIDVQKTIVSVTPQFFFAVSTVLFVISYFPIGKKLQRDQPDKIREAYEYWVNWKLRWQYAGFALFLAGLFAIAFVSLAGLMPQS